MDSSSELIPPGYDFLQSELGFTVASDDRSPYFGDAAVVLSSGSFSVRFSRDRGDIYLEVAGEPHAREWHDLDLVRVLIQQRNPAERADQETLATFLRQNHSGVAELFSRQNIDATRAQLEKLRHKRLKDMFPGSISN